MIDRRQSRRNTIILTETGEKVYETAREILNQLERLDLYLSQFKKTETKIPVVTIITNSPVGSYLLPEVLNDFKKLKPEYRVDVIIEMNYLSLADAIQKGLYDIAILPEPPNEVGIDFVFQEHLTVVANKHVYDPKYSYKFEDLPLVLPPKNSPVRRILDRYFSQKGIKPNVMLELSHPESMKKTVKLGKGVAILSFMCVKEDVDHGDLVILEVANDLPIISYSAVHPLNKPVTESVQLVLNFFREKLT